MNIADSYGDHISDAGVLFETYGRLLALREIKSELTPTNRYLGKVFDELERLVAESEEETGDEEVDGSDLARAEREMADGY